MAKWSFHRPASRASSKPTRRSDTSKAPANPNSRKTATGRWSFHKPEEVRPPEGHGWHFDGPEQVRTKGKVALGERWTCDYGCKSFVWSKSPEPGQYHAWDCPYWQHEGKDQTPF